MKFEDRTPIHTHILASNRFGISGFGAKKLWDAKRIELLRRWSCIDSEQSLEPTSGLFLFHRGNDGLDVASAVPSSP